MKIENLNDLFLHTVKDIYFAERHIVKALPKMVKAADSKELAKAFEGHLEESPDIGVLDVNLGPADAFPIAIELHQRRIPFVFTTGSGDSMRMPAEFVDAPIVRKPYTPEALRQALRACLGLDPSET